MRKKDYQKSVRKENIMTGRKTKLTPERQERLLKYIELGVTARQAIACVGIGETSYYKWKRLGETGREPYASFLQAVNQSEAKLQCKLVSVVYSAASKDWRAAMTLLARRWPKHWGKQRGYICESSYIPERKPEPEPENSFADIPEDKMGELSQKLSEIIEDAKVKKKSVE